MKKLITMAVAFLLTANLFAQSNKEDIDIIQAIFGKDKKELVNVYMKVPEAKSAEFWKLYDEYEAERKELGRERIAIIEEYATNYTTLDDKKASDIMAKKIDWTEKYGKFQKSYFKKFSGVLGGLQASKFMQLEDYIETCIRGTVQESIPFIGELDKSKKPGQ